MTYKEFLETKIELATESGTVINPAEVNPVLKPHQRDAVMWALKGGRRALFESFGLGKTVQELEFCHLTVKTQWRPGTDCAAAGRKTGVHTGRRGGPGI